MARPMSSIRRQNSTAARSDTSNVFADRHALDDIDPDLDFGFTQDSNFSSDTMSRRTSTASDNTLYAVSSATTHPADEPDPTPFDVRREQRNSIRKSRGMLENPFGGQEDDEEEYGVGASTSSNPTPHMEDGPFSDDNEYADTHSIHHNGPSHDYSGFSQDTTAAPLTRSPIVPSIITTQTTGRQSLHGPAHPYNMYPQNVDDDIDDTTSQLGGPRSDHASASTQRIPVGFPISVSRFRHDADNLSEQLPPYSEYPEGGAPKHVNVPRRISEVPTPTSASTSHTILPTARAPQSMSDSNHQSADMSLPSVEASLLPQEPKTWRQKSWSEKRKTKFCGIPFGWIALVLGVLFFIAVVIGAAIGGFFHALRTANKKISANALLDAQPLHEHEAFLPSGSYQLQLGPSSETENNCVSDPSQSASWSCGMSFPGAMAIDIINTENSTHQMARVYQAVNSSIGYGTEIPNTWSSPLKLVTDLDSPGMGPAYQFQAFYTKIVVAPSSAFEPAHVDLGSSSPSSAQPDITKRFWAPLTQPGDQPWFCQWNNTLLEGFVYLTMNSTPWYSNSSGWGSSQWHHGNKRMEPIATPLSSAPSSSTSSSTPSSALAQGSSETSIPSTPTTGSGPSCTYPSGPMHHTAAGDSSTACPQPPWEETPAASTLPFYPLVVKVEERRVTGEKTAPICQKMVILEDGTATPITKPDGSTYIVKISESSPGMSAYTSAFPSSSGNSKRGLGMLVRKNKRTLVRGACHCQWMSGQPNPH